MGFGSGLCIGYLYPGFFGGGGADVLILLLTVFCVDPKLNVSPCFEQRMGLYQHLSLPIQDKSCGYIVSLLWTFALQKKVRCLDIVLIVCFC